MLKRIIAAAFVAALASACDSTQSNISSSSGSTHSSTTGHVTSGNGNNNTTGSTGSNTTGGSSNTTGNGSTSGTATATNGTTEGSTGQTTVSNTTGNNTTTSNTTSGNTTGNTTTSNTTTGNTTSGNTTSNTTGTTTGTTTSGTTTGTTTTGTTTGTTGCVQSDIPTVRSPATPFFTEVCVSNVVVVGANNAGNALPDGGGTQYNGEYYVADSNANAIEVFKTKYASPIDDPTRGDEVNVDGITKQLPTDGGPTATIEIAGLGLRITAVSAGAVPTPKTVNFSDLDHASPTTSLIGSYVLVPAGSYTENFTDPGLQFHASNGNTYQDGFSLTSGANTIWVDTYDLGKGAADKSCIPTDGGMPDFSAGGFKAVFDYGLAPNGTQSAILLFGDCNDQP